jgi:hypothetical protein
MSTRSSPSTFSALVLVSQAGNGLGLSGDELIHVGAHVDQGDLVFRDAVLGQQRAGEDKGCRLRGDGLADHVLRFADSGALEREIGEGMLLVAGGERLYGNAGRARQHDRGARRDRAKRRLAGGDAGDAVDIRSARDDFQLDALLGIKTLLLGDDLAENAVGCEPAELHANLGWRLRGGRRDADQAMAGGSAAERCGSLQEFAPRFQKLRHVRISHWCASGAFPSAGFYEGRRNDEPLARSNKEE